MGKQPTIGQKKSKDAISKAASSRSKTVKKKWTKGRAKDKINNAVFLDQTAYNSIASQLPKIGKLVTVSVLSEKFKINGSIARKVIRHFASKGVIVPSGDRHSKQFIYTISAATISQQQTTQAAAEQKQATKKGQAKK